MLASLNPILEPDQLGRHPLRVGDALELEASVPGLPADVREAPKTERLRLAKATRRPPLGSESAELDQPRLLNVQLQVELREPVAKLRPEPLTVLPMLESHHGIMSEPHDDNVTAGISTPPLMGPKIEDVVRMTLRATAKPKPLAERLPRTPSKTRSQ